MARYDQQLVRREGSAWRRLGNVPLCDVCGAQDVCDLKAALSVLGQHRGASMIVPQCRDYLPVVGFQDCTGVEGSFNTFRRGKGWARRVQLGTRVGLRDMKADRLMGHARVTEIHTGELGALLPQHSAANHLMKSLSPQEAPAALQRVLRRLYGTTYGAIDQQFCVIYFEEEGKT